MLLAIDVGNTNTNFGIFEGGKLVRTWSCPTDKCQMTNVPALRDPESLYLIWNRDKCQINEVIICSVVPDVERKLKAEIRKQLAVVPYFVTAENIPGIKVRMRKISEVGADRVVDALAAYTLYGGPCIVVDFGTATTFDVVSAKGEYLGGAIAPGISLARDALYSQTAKLPKVEIKAPRNVIGKDTVSAMQSGLVYGYVALVEGMVEKLAMAYRPIDLQAHRPKVIATGGYAQLICKYTRVVDTIDQELTLKGLRMIGEMNALAF